VTAAVAVMGYIALPGAAPRAFGQAQPPAQQKKVKDQGEYDLFNAVAKETDAEKKLKLLDQWREKYPDSDFREERLQYYNTVNNPAKVLEAGAQILAKDEANTLALYLMTLNVTKLPSPSPEQLATGQKAAKGLQANMDKLFSAEKKPAATSEADWKKARGEVETMAHGALLWMAMIPGTQAIQKKDFAAAEAEFTKVLQQFPSSAQSSYLMGSAMVSQKKIEKYPAAMYAMARAVALEPAQGGLPDANRKEIDGYLTRLYTKYHGSDAEGLKQLKELSKASPFPPADFKIKTEAEILIEKEEEFKKSNPQLALWLSVKKELVGASGEQYFESSVKGAAVPKLKGTVISGKPPLNSKELVVGIEKADVPEITLKLDAALKGKPKPGNVIEFEGVPAAFTKEPFMLIFEVEKAKIENLEVEAPPPPVKKAVGKKTGATKKK
jgi:TolA-binding protein